jgi:hypothetical protein
MASDPQSKSTMANVLDRHLDEGMAEKYSLGRYSPRRVVEIETHLLICESCRQAVTASDAYVAAMRNAAAKVMKREPKSQGRSAAR